MHSLAKYFETDYFFNLASFIIGILGFLASLRINRTNNNLYLFKYYFLSYVVCTLAVYFEVILFTHSPRILFESIRYTDLLFTFSEFLIPIIFFQRLFIKRKIESNAIFFAKYTFLVVSVGLLIFDMVRLNELSYVTMENIFTLQAICLLVPCIFYYRMAFIESPGRAPISELPEFWIVTGISFFMLCTLPFSLLTNLLSSTFNTNYIIFDIFYCLLFLAFIRAFWCRTTTNPVTEKKTII
jgi:hypothetical protein